MKTIRPALVEKFGFVPVLEMYRQAAIRCQKARLWELSRDWASRGIAMYGEDAARPEVVEDLRKRVEYASSKLDVLGAEQSRSDIKTVTVQVGGVVLETLTCVECGVNFQRPRTRGRKPTRCPSCSAMA